ncbi:hypothetical protein [Streptomyces sp. NPDC006971]
MIRPPKRHEPAASGPGRRYPVGGTRPNTGPRSDEHPDTYRNPDEPKES